MHSLINLLQVDLPQLENIPYSEEERYKTFIIEQQQKNNTHVKKIESIINEHTNKNTKEAKRL
jgi:hypothetical protein